MPSGDSTLAAKPAGGRSHAVHFENLSARLEKLAAEDRLSVIVRLSGDLTSDRIDRKRARQLEPAHGALDVAAKPSTLGRIARNRVAGCGGAPGTPRNVSAVAGNARATVSWAAPDSDGGSPITNYVVTPYVGSTAQAPTTAGNDTEAVLRGLTNGTTYTFTVRARNAVGGGSESAASNSVTPQRGRRP